METSYFYTISAFKILTLENRSRISRHQTVIRISPINRYRQ